MGKGLTENADDRVEIRGLSPLLDDQLEPPYLELELRCNGQDYRAALLAAEGEWAVRVENERGQACTIPEDLYATQADALLVALLIALDHSRRSQPAS